ncbi:MAG: PaaI family thioesterase [Pseudomonadota bacterium]
MKNPEDSQPAPSTPSGPTGLQILQAMQTGRIPPSGIAATMPMRLITVEQGHIAMEVSPDARHLNPAGAVHGGFAATCLDGAAALALLSALGAGAQYSTVDLNVKYVRPLAEGLTYVATGRLVEQTRSLGICSAEIRGVDGKLHAMASATLMVKA